MTLLSKVLLTVFFIAVAQAKETQETCPTSELIRGAHLTCIACGLKKLGRPMPDDNFLAAAGILVREKTALFDDEVNIDVNKKKTRRSLSANEGEITDFGSGPVEITAQAKYQRSVIEMILASGYCGQGKIKHKVKDKDKNKVRTYPNYLKRLNSSLHPELKEEKAKRDDIAEEIGFRSWSYLENELWVGSKDEPFFELSFEKQKEMYRDRRKSAIARGSRGYDGPFSRSDINDCLEDIDKEYAPTNFAQEKAYDACSVMYNECDIATVPRKDGEQVGATMRNGTRVGGDWCAKKYKTSATNFRIDGTPLAPIEDKSSKSLKDGSLLTKDNKIIMQNGDVIDGNKVTIFPDGGVYIAPDAVRLKPTDKDDKNKMRPPNGEAGATK